MNSDAKSESHKLAQQALNARSNDIDLFDPVKLCLECNWLIQEKKPKSAGGGFHRRISQNWLIQDNRLDRFFRNADIRDKGAERLYR